MARHRKQKDGKIKLSHPDRSGPDPTQETLLDMAEKRGLLKTAEDEQEVEGLDENGEPLIGRFGESFLWSVSLTMLHFTLDVLVAHQYAVAIKWPELLNRTAQAFPSSVSTRFSKTMANGSSYPSPRLLFPSSPDSLTSSTDSTCTNTAPRSPDILLRW